MKISLALKLSAIIMYISRCESVVSLDALFAKFYFLFRRLGIAPGSIGLFDPTEIHNRGLLKRHMKEAMVKLGCHAVNFILFLYRYDDNCLFFTWLNFSGKRHLHDMNLSNFVIFNFPSKHFIYSLLVPLM